MGILNLTAMTFAILLLLAGAINYILAWRRERPKRLLGEVSPSMPLRLGWLVWGALLLFASFSAWFSMGRFVVTVFPIFIVVAMYLDRHETFLGYVYLSALLLALYTILYTHHFWVA